MNFQNFTNTKIIISDYNCQLSTFECPRLKNTNFLGELLPEIQYNYFNKCIIDMNTDYKSINDFKVIKLTKQHSNYCCYACYMNPSCVKFTYDTKNNYCYLKSNSQNISIVSDSITSSYLVSGMVIAK